MLVGEGRSYPCLWGGCAFLRLVSNIAQILAPCHTLLFVVALTQVGCVQGVYEMVVWGIAATDGRRLVGALPFWVAVCLGWFFGWAGCFAGFVVGGSFSLDPFEQGCGAVFSADQFWVVFAPLFGQFAAEGFGEDGLG